METAVRYVEELTGCRVVDIQRRHDRMAFDFILEDGKCRITTYRMSEDMLGQIRRVGSGSNQTGWMSSGQIATTNTMQSNSQSMTYQVLSEQYHYAMKEMSRMKIGPQTAPAEKPKVACPKCGQHSCSGKLDARGRCEYKSRKFAEKVRVLYQHRKRS